MKVRTPSSAGNEPDNNHPTPTRARIFLTVVDKVRLSRALFQPGSKQKWTSGLDGNGTVPEQWTIGLARRYTPTKTNLVLIGPPSVGKTQLAIALGREPRRAFESSELNQN